MILFKSVKPATQFKSSIFRDELRAAAQAMAPQIKKDFQATVKTWKDKPEFTTEVKVGNPAGGSLARSATGSASGVSVEVTTDSDIYRYVDEGTKRHPITAKRAPYLVFNYPNRPKTKPKVIGSTKGSVGKHVASKKTVMHPGTKPRQFTKTISKKWNKDFRKNMDKALQTAARRSGHAMTK